MEPKERERLIDEWLDGTLKQRGAVEPRPGLEDRVLASLWSASNRMPARAWSWRPAWIALATTLLIGGALFLARRSGRGQQIATGTGAPARLEAPTIPESHPSQSGAKALSARHHRQGSLPRHAPENATLVVPRLDHFPSPQPLSEQEQILARYVQQFPREAGLMARAQTALFEQETIERQQPGPRSEILTSSDQQNP